MVKTIHRLWRKTGLGLLIFLLCFGLMACGQQPKETEAACRVSEDGEPVSVYEQDDHADHVTVTFQKTDGPETLDIAIYPRIEDGVAAEPAAQKAVSIGDTLAADLDGSGFLVTAAYAGTGSSGEATFEIAWE